MGQGVQWLGGGHAGAQFEGLNSGHLEGLPCAALLFDRHGKLLASNSRADDLHTGGCQTEHRHSSTSSSGLRWTLTSSSLGQHDPCWLLSAGIDKALCTFEKFAQSVEVCGAALTATEVLQALLGDTACIQ
jgi:hypothetical protein